VSEVAPHPAVAAFLWEQVAPEFGANSFRLRRTMCARLAAMGATAWGELADPWRDLVDAARTADLSSQARPLEPDWGRWGLPVASLAWTLPSLTDRLSGDARSEALDLLRALRGIVAGRPVGRAVTPGPTPDIGLEISLAEGFKYASVLQPAGSEATRADRRRETEALLAEALSWRSKQVLLQALALSDLATGGPARPSALRSPVAAVHPFVAETVALVARSAGDAASSEQQRSDRVLADVWSDDVDALEDGGVHLSAPAHRLLALSTLLINLAEGALRREPPAAGGGAGPRVGGVDARDLAFSADVLPRCFRRAAHTAAMFEVDCDCPFGLCGPHVEVQVGDRRISRAFTQRAEATSHARPVIGGRPFVRGPFAAVWRDPRVVGDDDGQ
jgi:hypothetical protein